MQLDLPTPIENYFRSEQTDDTELLGEIFADNAVVRDESATHRDLDAIKTWKSDGKKKTDYTIEPQSVRQREGETVISAEVAGSFPESPAMLTHGFKLLDERIIELEIH